MKTVRYSNGIIENTCAFRESSKMPNMWSNNIFVRNFVAICLILLLFLIWYTVPASFCSLSLSISLFQYAVNYESSDIPLFSLCHILYRCEIISRTQPYKRRITYRSVYCSMCVMWARLVFLRSHSHTFKHIDIAHNTLYRENTLNSLLALSMRWGALCWLCTHKLLIAVSS